MLYTPETNIVLYVNYNKDKLEGKKLSNMQVSLLYRHDQSPRS